MLAKSPHFLPALLVALSVFTTVLWPHAVRSKQEPAPPFEPTLPWLTDLDEALAAAKISGRPILLEFR